MRAICQRERSYRFPRLDRILTESFRSPRVNGGITACPLETYLYSTVLSLVCAGPSTDFLVNAFIPSIICVSDTDISEIQSITHMDRSNNARLGKVVGVGREFPHNEIENRPTDSRQGEIGGIFVLIRLRCSINAERDRCACTQN